MMILIAVNPPFQNLVTFAIEPRFRECAIRKSPDVLEIIKTRLYSQGDVLSGSVY
jgi:hypothetical protein